ncbi:MAG TPA: hypothetical protein VGO48_09980 [Conexibacter sp.]|jgi:hypothetical protein|nr:hypothetical protein [Conexibacter sp.]
MRPKLIVLVLCLCALLSALGSAPAGAAQRIDMRVLLLGAAGWEPSLAAWEAQLRREGVPYDEIIARPGHTPIRAETLSRRAGEVEEARYQAVIVAVGNLPVCEERGCFSALAAEEWTALAEYERTFHVRQLSAYIYPAPEFGMNWPSGAGAMEGVSSSLTTAGRTTFPYLNGTVTIGAGTYGYLSTGLEASFTPLVADGSGNALVGVYRHAEGREEMVQTFDGNQYQIHSQLLRHGQLAWVTRGTYLGDQRNYLELQVDDIFLPDDIWDPETHRTNYNPEAAVRMRSEDVTEAVEWTRATGLRLDMVFNGGGSVEYAEAHEGRDPLLTAFRSNAAAFGWINHTYDHPNLDCSTQRFIEDEIGDNVEWARGAGLTIDGGELVTGEHSGLANLVPGNPGTIDPPWQDEPRVTATGGSLAAGSWEYGLTATNEAGETIPELENVTTTGSTSEVRLEWEAICHARTYRVYRRRAGGSWAVLNAVSQPERAFTDEGPVVISYTDRGSAGSGATPPSVNGARLSPYGQNPAFTAALEGQGVDYIATDNSKPYPVTPTEAGGPTYPAGSTWLDGRVRAVPRYPTNVYYNVATRRQLLDEYNYLYLPPERGGVCVLTEVTTCFTTAATWEVFVERESLLMFSHMMGNDPRPHYFHQTNLAESRSAEGAVLYPVVDATLALYERYFAVGSTPIQQLTHTQIGDLLARQAAWAGVNARTVVGYIEREEVVVTNGERSAVELPLTGTEIGTSYGGSTSGWDEATEGVNRYTAATAWP